MEARMWTIEAWIHPKVGGDDYQKAWSIDTSGYGNTLSDIKKLAKKLIKKEGSEVLNDFKIYLNGVITK